MKNGNSPFVTVDRHGEKVRLRVEANVRYNKINFFDLEGRPVKREELLKEPTLNNLLSKDKSQEKQLDNGMEIGR